MSRRTKAAGGGPSGSRPAEQHVVIYAHVLKQALEDLEGPTDRGQASEFWEALSWSERGGYGGLLDVAICCTPCGIPPATVYEGVR